MTASRSLAHLSLAVLLLLVASGCLGSFAPPPVRPGMVREQTVIILVEGTAGLPFSGSYGTPTATSSVQDTVPTRYTVKTAVGVAATFTKADEQGDLVVRILVEDREVLRRATSAPYGTITVFHNVLQ